MLYMPFGIEEMVPTKVLETRMARGEMKTTDLQPYSRRHLDFDIDGFKKIEKRSTTTVGNFMTYK